jgi:hypothetical protein
MLPMVNDNIFQMFIMWPLVSCAGSHFYGTEYEIWADFGPVGNTGKIWAGKYASFEGVFYVFIGKKNIFFKYCTVHTKKLHNINFI